MLGTTSPSAYGDTSADPALVAGAFMVLIVFYLLAIVLALVVAGITWGGVFRKAGHARWKAFVPFYNTWILVKIAGRPESHFWLQFIPYAGLYWSICTLNDVSKSFGKDTAYTVGLVFLPVVFASMLSYGGAQYRGPSYLTNEQKWYAQQYAQHYGQPQNPSGPAQ